MRVMSFTFMFVCQRGELEIKALLLAASLRRFLPPNTPLIAALPANAMPDKATLAELAALEVSTAQIHNPLAADYPIGHKLACLGLPVTTEYRVFLDSDMLCVRPWQPEEWWGDAQMYAKPVDLANFSADPAFWQPIYHQFGLTLPDRRLLATVSQRPIFLYFNAGMIAVQAEIPLAQTWIACCQAIDRNPNIPNKRPWLDQLGLPVAMTSLGVQAESLDERFNFPAHLKPLPNDNDAPFLVHYHAPSVIAREPTLRTLTRQLLSPRLRYCMSEQPPWAELLIPPRMFSVNRHAADIIITGIPRSGTSYLCRLLHEVDDCVVINEPAQIFAPLSGEESLPQFAQVYQALRQNILDGKAVENKIHQGKLIEDTRVLDQREHYHPAVQHPDFTLATKNTLAYLARLPQLRAHLPHAPIVACIRHPSDTIASWKTSFPHLRDAQVEGFPIGHPQDTLLSSRHRLRIQEVSAMPQLPMRRALLWRALAQLLWEERDRILLVRYEELVNRPEEILKQIFSAISQAYQPKHPPQPSQLRQQREVLDHEDEQAIKDLCAETALWFNYELYRRE